MNTQIIVLIGGPGSGKTTIINALEAAGHCCFPEISRAVIAKAQQEGIDQLFLEEPLLFSKMLLDGRIKQFQEAQLANNKTVFIDRGIPDVLAYLEYIGSQYPLDFVKACEDNRYAKVFILPPWEEIHTVDKERYENFEQASEIYLHLKTTYKKFGYSLVEVPKDTLANRVSFLLNHV